MIIITLIQPIYVTKYGRKKGKYNLLSKEINHPTNYNFSILYFLSIFGLLHFYIFFVSQFSQKDVHSTRWQEIERSEAMLLNTRKCGWKIKDTLLCYILLTFHNFFINCIWMWSDITWHSYFALGSRYEDMAFNTSKLENQINLPSVALLNLGTILLWYTKLQ